MILCITLTTNVQIFVHLALIEVRALFHNLYPTVISYHSVSMTSLNCHSEKSDSAFIHPLSDPPPHSGSNVTRLSWYRGPCDLPYVTGYMPEWPITRPTYCHSDILFLNKLWCQSSPRVCTWIMKRISIRKFTYGELSGDSHFALNGTVTL